MNKTRRELLKRAAAALVTAEECVNSALEEEQDALDNMPENLESSERYETMESAVDNLEGALEDITSAQSYIESAIYG